MIKKIITTLFCLLSILIVCSQERHEISVSASGGLSSINYSPYIGQSSNKNGNTIGIGYNYRITDSWSIGSGIELLIMKSGYNVENASDSYVANDGEDNFIFNTTLEAYSESQNISYLNIPIVMMFQHPIAGRNNFYALAGFRFGIPVQQQVDINASFNSYGYYPKWENPIKDNPYFMGFGNFESINEKGSIELKALYSLSIESGMKWGLGDKLNLYSGVFCDYGLNNIKQKTNKRLIQYNIIEPTEYIHNSVINSSFSNEDNSTRQLVDNVRVISVGLRLRLALNL